MFVEVNVRFFVSIWSSSPVDPAAKKNAAQKSYFANVTPGWPSSCLKSWIFNHWVLARLDWCLSLCRSRIPLCTQGFLRYRLTNQPPVTRQPTPDHQATNLDHCGFLFFRQQQKYRGHSRTPSQTMHYWGDIPQNYHKHYLIRTKMGQQKSLIPEKKKKQPKISLILKPNLQKLVATPQIPSHLNLSQERGTRWPRWLCSLGLCRRDSVK